MPKGDATLALIDAAFAMNGEAPDKQDLAFLARQLIVCTLPHSDPGDVKRWRRTNGRLTLSIRPYLDPVTDTAQYPYGSIPRLLLFWLVTEAKQRKSRRIPLGRSLDAFMRQIGLDPRTGGGRRGDAKRLHYQMRALFRALISFEDSSQAGERWRDMQVAPEGEFWWEAAPGHGQPLLWESWVELGEKFYESITASAVPLDVRALRALKRSPLALDMYALIAYETHRANENRRRRVIPWEGLHAQMGGDYSDIRDFHKKVKATLRKIKLVYPAMDAEATREGLVARPARRAVPKKM